MLRVDFSDGAWEGGEGGEYRGQLQRHMGSVCVWKLLVIILVCKVEGVLK